MRIRVLDHAVDIYRAELVSGFRPKMDGDAGVDLRTSQDVHITAGTTAVIPLGVAIELDGPHVVGRIVGRSSTLLTYSAQVHEGVVDSGYRGELHLIITAISRGVSIPKGSRVCQLLVQPVVPPDVWETADSELTETARGHQGLGSTGRT
jgi:dUTP diphosphatase